MILAVGGCSSSSSSPAGNAQCTGSGRCVTIAAGESESDISAAFASVKDGDTLAFAAGTFTFDNQLALGTANDVTVIGAGMGKTILDFKGQKQGDDALFAQSVQNLTYEDLTVRDAPGNATRALMVTGLTYRSMEVTWTASDSSTHGAYGLYPVQSANVLIEKCKISGASDSGVYVGQSQQIVVRDNEAFKNVAGIEIENSFFADVYDNDSHDNVAGILVFDLPGLQQEGGHDIRVHGNTIQSNNTFSFAASGDIVSLVPAGTGFFVMANHDVEVFGNEIVDNNDSASGIISYALAQMPTNDANYDEYPSKIYLHDNTYTGNGGRPDFTKDIGGVLLTGESAYPGGHVPDVLWDGIVDPSLPAGTNPQQICIHEPQASAVCDMHFDQIDPNNPDESKAIVCDPSPFDCTMPPLAPVSFPGLPPAGDAG
ncbi:MAG TPA: parallel beta-helix domain-containing protein [Polyangiaceae bacterium]|nr:parallel beta-helix domain-containing protein [Polyangiaceae bacterium]